MFLNFCEPNFLDFTLVLRFKSYSVSRYLFPAGGAAGSVARITGSVGGALAALSFDQDYKRVC